MKLCIGANRGDTNIILNLLIIIYTLFTVVLKQYYKQIFTHTLFFFAVRVGCSFFDFIYGMILKMKSGSEIVYEEIPNNSNGECSITF